MSESGENCGFIIIICFCKKGGKVITSSGSKTTIWGVYCEVWGGGGLHVGCGSCIHVSSFFFIMNATTLTQRYFP